MQKTPEDREYTEGSSFTSREMTRYFRGLKVSSSYEREFNRNDHVKSHFPACVDRNGNLLVCGEIMTTSDGILAAIRPSLIYVRVPLISSNSGFMPLISSTSKGMTC